jgi:hypothetical protein
MAEWLRTVHMRGRGLPWGWCQPVGPKLVCDQMAASVPDGWLLGKFEYTDSVRMWGQVTFSWREIH